MDKSFPRSVSKANKNEWTFSGFSSLAIHSGHESNDKYAHQTPIYASSTYVYDTAEQGMRRFSGKENGYIYSRWGNPTFTDAEQKIAALETFGLVNADGSPMQVKGILHASGMAAISTMFLSILKAGDKILSHYSLYGGTEEITHNIFPDLGIERVIVDLRDLDKAEAAMKADPKIKLLYNKGSPPISNNEFIVDNYAFDDKGRYWYAIRGFALAMQDGDNVYEQSKPLAHLGDEAFDVLWDAYRKKIIVAVRTQKFPCQFNDASYSILPVFNNIEVKGNIMRLHQCTNGIILFATDEGTVFSIDKQNICKRQLNEFGTHGRASWFFNDPSGDVWIIYNGRGLRHYAWQKDSLVFKEQFTKANGLSTDNVTSMCFDNKNNLWISTYSTVAVFSKKNNTSNNGTYQIVGFYNAEDLQTDRGFGARLTKDKKGNIWYFSSNYLICLYPDKINYNPLIPSIEIENVELNFRQTNWTDYADSLSGIFQLPYDLKLAHDNNTLSIYFKGISSSGTDGLKYSYQLEGLENIWSNPSSNDFVSFARLPPGKYVFKVKAQLPNSNWSEPAVFSFEIKKAFWQTWWFYILIGLVLTASVYILFRYRLSQKIKLLEMRNRISQDLHDEIGASMSGINLLSQVATEKLQNNKLAEASEYLVKVKNYSQDVIEKLSDMVWLFNPQNDSIEKLLQRLKYFAISIASSKNATIHFTTGKEDEIINLTIRQRKVIYLVSKEAINNAVKYSECGNIYYSLTRVGSGWKLYIRDDGKGFLPSENKNGNGLKNMHARANEIGAKFNLQTNPGIGTIITMEL